MECNMLLENNCNNLFDEVSKLNYSWLSDMKAYVNERIAFYEAALISEAKLDKNESLANYDYLYECFKRNDDYEEIHAQYEVLKYLRVHMIIKCLKYMIGEWTFVDSDKEMLDNLVAIQNKERCMPRVLKFKSIDTPIENVVEGLIFRNYELHYYVLYYYNKLETIVSGEYTTAFYMIPFLTWINMLLQVTTGKGYAFYENGDWNKMKIISTLDMFFNYKFNPVDSYNGDFILDNEEHTVNVHKCEKNKLYMKIQNKVFDFVMMLSCFYKEDDKSKFQIRNKIIMCIVNFYFRHISKINKCTNKI